MALDPPLPGQVIRYAYLWWNEARVGHGDGVKDRPCGIVLTRQTELGKTMVYVLPITHTPPRTQEDGIEIPAATKQRLGLDAERSWIITNELNRFAWPGPDIRPTAPGDYVYGYLPEKLMQLVLAQVRRHADKKELKTIPRTE